MGFDYHLGSAEGCHKRKFRWMVYIPEVAADQPINSLPPMRSARPAISFREVEAKHVSENMFYPIMKPEWRALPLVLFDLRKNRHPVFAWLKRMYDPAGGTMGYPQDMIIPGFRIVLFDGCGNTVETWILEDAWPTSIDFGDLDYGNVEICTCDLQLRYARSYLQEG